MQLAEYQYSITGVCAAAPSQPHYRPPLAQLAGEWHVCLHQLSLHQCFGHRFSALHRAAWGYAGPHAARAGWYRASGVGASLQPAQSGLRQLPRPAGPAPGLQRQPAPELALSCGEANHFSQLISPFFFFCWQCRWYTYEKTICSLSGGRGFASICL